MNKNLVQKTLLIVDDEPEIRELFKAEFEFDGYRVLQANDGQAALDILINTNVDVVLTDLMMPRMDGVSLIQRIRSSALIQPRLYLMSGCKQFSPEETKDIGVRLTFAKPFDFNDVVEAILND